MNNKLKDLRLSRRMTQNDIAILANCTRSNYSLIETGRRKGSREFWSNIQTAFNLSDSEVWEMLKNESSNATKIHNTAC